MTDGLQGIVRRAKTERMEKNERRKNKELKEGRYTEEVKTSMTLEGRVKNKIKDRESESEKENSKRSWSGKDEKVEEIPVLEWA